MAMTFADSIINAGTMYAGNSPAMNLAYGGQDGFLPKIGLIAKDGKYYGEWISNQAYIKRNIIPILLQAPRFFDFLPDSQRWVGMWKSVMEDQPLTIDGLTSGLTVETDEHPIGGAGEVQEEITNVTRAKSSITQTYVERAGKSFTKLFDFIIRYSMMDPDTKTPLITRYFKSIGDIGNMYTPDFYTTTMLYIEPDITHKVVLDAWLCTNMFPKSNGERTGKRDLRSAGEKVEHSIEFSAITMNNEAVLRLGNMMLRNLTVLNKIPDLDMVLPIVDAEPRVQAVGNNGYNRN